MRKFQKTHQGLGFPLINLGGMYPILTGQFIDRFVFLDRFKRNFSFEVCTVLFALHRPCCRHFYLVAIMDWYRRNTSTKPGTPNDNSY